jgi:hypothetical protein
MLQAGYALMNFLCLHVEIVDSKMAKAELVQRRSS